MAHQGDPLGNWLGGLGSFQDAINKTTHSIPKPEKGVPWHAKVIDGAYYVPLTDVLELLKQNGVLPQVQAGLERRIARGPNSD